MTALDVTRTHRATPRPLPTWPAIFREARNEPCEKPGGSFETDRRAMPPFGQRLSSGEIDDVIAYIHTLRPPATIKPD